MNSSDSTEIMRLISVDSPNKEDFDSIFNLYKKYIEVNLQSYQVGCGCGNDIMRLFDELKKWYIKNNI